jgi:GH25 family lysozyme M1 (1,4-beta-N-acetylmuramidase)
MKKTAKILAILLVMLTVVQFPVTAFASTKTGCNFNSNTYTHQTKFDNQQIHQGIDVSSHNESLDYSKIKASGVEFVIVRVGYRGYGSKGNVLKDKYFEENIESAKKAGLKVGAYFYTQATTEAEAEYEANFVLEYIKKYDLDLPVFYDIEFAEDSNGFTGRLYNANLSKAKMTNLALAFCDTIENAGYKAGVYASKSFFEDEMNSSTLEAKEYVIWLAHYTTSTK